MDTGMVFAIIFAALFIGYLLVFASGSIADFFCFTSKADTLRAVNDLKTTVEGIYAKSRGTTVPFSLNIPSDSKVCFFDTVYWGKNEQHYTRDRYWTGPEDSEYIELQLGDELSSYYGSNVWIYHCGGNRGFTITRLKPLEGSAVHSLDDLEPGDENGHRGNFCAPPGTELILKNAGNVVLVYIAD
jgi:hypothetical protein